MKRTIKGGALLAAPLIIAGSLFGGASLAADRQVIPLQLDAVCTDADSETAVFALQNKNDFDIDVQWENLDTGYYGSFTVPAHSFYGDADPVNNPGLTPGYATDYDPSIANNTTSFTAEGWSSPSVTNANAGTACTDEQLPVDDGGDQGDTPVDNGNGGSTNNGGSTTGEAGKGGDTSATNGGTTTVSSTKAANPTELADTGAQQVIPMAAAGLIAVAVLGTTIAVRKNVL